MKGIRQFTAFRVEPGDKSRREAGWEWEVIGPNFQLTEVEQERLRRDDFKRALMQSPLEDLNAL